MDISVLEVYLKLKAKYKATLERMSEVDRKAFEDRLRTMARRTIFEYEEVRDTRFRLKHM
jgi:hypothetical protein